MKAAVAAFFVCMLPVAAAAQEAAAAAQNSGPMIVQRTHSTFVIAPDYKFSRVDGRDANIAGVYGGVLLDEQWLLGAGGYWLANGSGGRSLGYGGAVVGWMTPADRTVGFSARSLVGWGEARLTDTVTIPGIRFADNFPDHFGPPRTMGHPTPFPIPTPAPRTFDARSYRQFFVVEPQADVIFRVARWGRIDAGAGYRAIGAADRSESRLRGATASVSFQVGNF